MEQKVKYKSMQNFAILAVSLGILLVVAAIIGAANIFVYSGRTILFRAVTSIRTDVERIVFSLVVPLVGGVVLIIAGLKLLHIDNATLHKNAVSNTRRKITQQKEQMLNVFLNDDEKRVMDLIKKDSEGALQSDLVIKTGYSKVKVHRILKSLENKGVIRRGRFGITNRVFISN